MKYIYHGLFAARFSSHHLTLPSLLVRGASEQPFDGAVLGGKPAILGKPSYWRGSCQCFCLL